MSIIPSAFFLFYIYKYNFTIVLYLTRLNLLRKEALYSVFDGIE